MHILCIDKNNTKIFPIDKENNFYYCCKGHFTYWPVQ